MIETSTIHSCTSVCATVSIPQVEGLIWLIVVPHNIVILEDSRALMQYCILIAKKLSHFKRACCVRTECDLKKSMQDVVFSFSQANFYMQ
jgi:hypothetical protein